MNKIVCYINSNYIDINKNNDNYHIISSSVLDGDIINKELFIKDMKSKKLFSNIMSNKLILYLNHIITEKDKMYYKDIFEELNCNNINILDTSQKLISPTLINSYTYYTLYFNNNYYNIIPELLEYYLKLFKINSLRIISKDKLSEIKSIKYYYYKDYFIC